MTHANTRKSGPAPFLSVRRVVALVLASTAAARGAQLPVPCLPGACGKAPSAPVGWSTTSNGQALNSAAASYVQSGNKLTVTQTASSAYLNWASFNISADGTVTFVQPSSTAVALNRVFDANPSSINGALNANGQVYLLNQNGFIFGPNAVVNVGGLLASSLNISPDALTKGIAGLTSNGDAPAFQPYVDANGKPLSSASSVTVQSGAQITSDQGQVFLFAANVDNEGSIQTPGGQTILGAGQRVFLAPAGANSPVRGLLIEVGDGGTVTNGVSGQIAASAGNVTLAGLAVNQNGRVSATTTVTANGSIRLQARDTSATTLTTSSGISTLVSQSGTLTLGPSSQTTVTLDGSGGAAVDANAQPKSNIYLYGKTIDVMDNASITAASGTVTLEALGDGVGTALDPVGPGTNTLGNVDAPPDQARIYLAPTSTIDVSGADVTLPMSANSLAVQLRGTELADFPQNRNGPLRGSTVYIDTRQYGTRTDGTSSTWVGSPIADLSGYIATIQRDVFERNLTGGTINLESSGSVIVSNGATLNVSGGRIDYQSGYLQSSVLLGPNGQAVPIAQANPDVTYVGVVDTLTQSDPRWGTSTTVMLPGHASQGQYVAGYTEGKDAGTVSIVAPAAVLDGTFNGSVAVGPNQRLAPTPSSTWTELYRPYDQVPVGGTLIVGNPSTTAAQAERGTVQVLQNATFQSGTVLSSLTGPSGQPFNPEVDPLPANFVTSIRPDLMGPNGMSNLQVYAQGTVTVPAGVTLAPGAGGSVSLTAGHIDLAGNIDIPGGNVSLAAIPTVAFPGVASVVGADPKGGFPALVVEPGVNIDVSGEWINDNPQVSGGATPALFTSGGTVTLSSTGGSLVFPSGATIDVSGGAYETAAGALTAGAAGSITVTANPGVLPATAPQQQVVVDGLMEGYALSQGGTLSLSLPEVCISTLPCSDAAAVRTDPSLFTDFGFQSVSVKANLGSLTVASDVNLTATQENYQLMSGALDDPSARSLANLSNIVLLPQYLRNSESIALNSDVSALVSVPDTQLPYALTIEDGARLAVDPGGSLSLTANSKIIDDGTLVAPGGKVSILLQAPNDPATNQPAYFTNQAIWLGQDALIDVSGTVLTTPNNLNLQLGSVLPGGTISVQAQGGYLFAAPGAQLNAAGASGTLDLQSPGSSSYTRSQVGSAGGTINLVAAEGLQFDGSLSATAGAGSNAPGGSLSVTLYDPVDKIGTLNPSAPDYPASALAARNLTVSATSSPIVVAEGSSIPAFLDGQGNIAASTIDAGGFDNVSLKVRNVGSTQAGIGSATFDSGVTLSPASQLVVDAPQIRAGTGGGGVTLASDYVALGSTDTDSHSVNSTPSTGTASLSVSGHLVDLVGAFDITGFGNTQIASSGDIRAVGVATGTSYVGSLTVPGSLTLSAQQIYPTTLTNYTIDVIKGGTAQSQLLVSGAAGTPDAVLSAAGSLSLQADQITVSGTLRAPMGALSLTGTSITLDPTANISVSTDGLTIPFGETQGGFDWVYQYTGGAPFTQVYGVASGDALPPQKSVTLNAGTLTIDPKATVDLSGGGDLQAYEYVPGLTGNADVLAPQSVRNPVGGGGTSSGRWLNAPNEFAIVPTQDLPYAPIDPYEDTGFTQALAGAGFTQTFGASVHLSGGGGVAAGTYAILPARYALLTGAYLVRPVAGYTNLAPGQTVSQLDGSTIVSGYRTYGSTGLGDTQTSGWDVAPGSYALQLATYNISTANNFFTSEATTANVTIPRLPNDAGALAIQVATQASLDGQLLTTTPKGGRGATVDLSTSGGGLLITDSQDAAPSGYVAIQADQLNSLGAESILIGGTRSAAANTTDIAVDTNNLVVDQGVQLAAQELIFVANQSLTIKPDASVAATGAAVAPEAPILLSNSGAAMVRVSTGPLTDLQSSITSSSGSSKSTTAGSITVDAGAAVSAPGSVSFDAGGAVSFAGDLSAAGAAIRLGASNIGLGEVPSGFNGFAIDSALFAGIANSNLELSSTAPLQVYGPVDLTLSQLRISAPGITDSTTDAAFNVTAGSLTLESPNTQAFAGAAAGTGSVDLSAAHILLAGGTFTVAGAKTTSLNASQDLTVTGSGTLGVAGDLTLGSAVTQSSAGVTYNFTAGGDLKTTLTGAAIGATSASGPGGALSFTGQSVSLGGNIVLPGGQVIANAVGPGTDGDVIVADGASINVAGFQEVFDGDAQSAPGGAIALTSSSGNVSVSPAATLDLSNGTGSASGGTLAMIAPSGTVTLAGQLHGSGATGQSGAGLTVDAMAFGVPAGSECSGAGCEFQYLVNTAQAAGFTGQWDIHELGSSQNGGAALVLLPGEKLVASGVTLVTDQGGVTVGGTIDTSSPLGGTIVLAGIGVHIESQAQLLAGSTTRSDRGGTIDIFSTGSFDVEDGALLSVGGTNSAATGTVWFRAPAADVLSVLSGAPQVYLGNNIVGAANVYLEGYNQYTTTSVSDQQMLADPSNPIYAAAQAFYNSATQGPTTVAQALGMKNTLTVVPGVEIDSSIPGSGSVADLTVTSASGGWDLSQWHFGPNSTPGVLTLRSSGNLNIDTSITDGIVNLNASGNLTLFGAGTGASWSYRMAAGADLNSPDPLSVVSVPELSKLGTTGNFVLAPGVIDSVANQQQPVQTQIVTGTGSIDIAAAGNVQLGNQASVIYTVGVAGLGTPIDATGDGSNFENLPYPVGGGSITVRAGQNVIGAPSTQLFSDWLWRTGPNEGGLTSWAPSISFFEQGIGALGGGDVTVTAGGNIVDLGANIPSVGVPSVSGNQPQVVDAGVLRVTAGGNIEGGKFLDMAGQAFISAGGALTTGTPQSGAGERGLYPVLALGSGQFDVTAREGLSLETILDPTLLPQPAWELPDQSGNSGEASFATYADTSSVTLRSIGSDVVLVNQTQANSPLQKSDTNLPWGNSTIQNAGDVILDALPPTLAAVALGGDVEVTGSMALWPSAHGNLNLLAADSVTFQATSNGGNIQVLMSDADPTLLPTPENPSPDLGTLYGVLNGALDRGAVGTSPVPFNALSPVHSGAFAQNGQPDNVPARIVAQSGDVSVVFPTGVSSFSSEIYIPKPLDLIAGQDISNLTLTVQQFAADNISDIAAGRDIVYPTPRSASGALVSNSGGITIDGPGQVTVSAGRDINLGTSNGIVSEGNLTNPALPVGGASITAEAGVPATLDYQTFINAYLEKSDAYDQQLIQYMEGFPGNIGLTKAQALAAFMALPMSQQTPLVETIFFDELRTGGRSAAAAGPTHGNFTQAFADLENLFPGSNPSSGQTNAYQGDVLLYFSRVYTEQGGDINILAPGGQVNVGLAAAPTAFGITKAPYQLGIVAESTGSIDVLAYSDIEVNQSRVFAADGGNILMWSTDGNIDAGRGAKTAISAPPPVNTINPQTGQVTTVFSQSLQGSGIQALASTPGTTPGDVDLFAPNGVVNANDAGIVAGNLTIFAQAVLGANNITVSGTSVGVPVAVTGLGVSLASASAAGSAATTVSENSASDSGKSDKTPLANTALGWLDVFVMGMGEEQCRTDDVECLKRQKHE